MQGLAHLLQAAGISTTKAVAGGVALVAAMATLYTISTDDKDPSNANAPAQIVKYHDSYIVNLNVTREGHELKRSINIPKGEVSSENRAKWTYGPTKISAQLVDERSKEDLAAAQTVYGLMEWDRYLALHIKHLRDGSNKPYAKRMNAVLEQAEAYQDDVALLLRVLEGMRYYRHIDKDMGWFSDDPDHIRSKQPYAFLEGGRSEKSYIPKFDKPRHEMETLKAWASDEDPNNGKSLAKGFAESLRLMVWKYSKEDMQRVEKLLKNRKDIEDDLTIDVSGFNLDDPKHATLKYAQRDLHDAFRNAFLRSLLEIQRLAWASVPTGNERIVWANSVDDVDPLYKDTYKNYAIDKGHDSASLRFRTLDELPYLRKDQKVGLPDLPTETLMAFQLPLRGIHKGNTPLKWYPAEERRGQYNVTPTEDEIYAVNDPKRMRHTIINLNWNGLKDPHDTLSVIRTAMDGPQIDGRLTITDNKDKTSIDNSGAWRSIDQHTQIHTIRWDIKAGAEICDDPTCFDTEEKENPEYTPPPVIAISAATFPAEPIPDEEAALGFRIQNTSDVIASAVSLELRLLSAMAETAPDSLVPHNEFCTTTASGRFRCDFGDMAPGAVADIMFGAKTPSNGLFLWAGDLTSKGDLGGLKKRGGFLGKRAKPKIEAVIVIDEQTAFEDSVPLNPYPFGPKGDGDVTRNLFVVGKNLPKEKEDVELTHSAKIKYFFEAFDDTDNPDHAAIIDKGWMKYYETDNAAEAKARAKKENLRGILVDTRLSKGVMPSRQTLKMNGTDGQWELQFGDITADVYFVRYIENEPFDLLTNAYAPGRVYLAVQTNMDLPIDSITLDLDLKGSNVAGAKSQKIEAKRASHLGKRIYLSPPLDLHPAGNTPSLEKGIGIPVNIRGKKPVKISAKIEDDFVARSFLLAKPPAKARVKIWTSPSSQETSWLWRDALRRAAACHDTVDEKNIENIGAEEAEALWNLIILTTSEHFPEQSVKFGHHAAALLLRDMYLNVAENQTHKNGAKYNEIFRTEEGLKGFWADLRARFYDDNNPILKIKVPSFDTPGTELKYEGGIEFRYIILNDPEWIAEQYNLSLEQVQAHRRRATIIAMDKMLEEFREAKEHAEEIEDCDVEDLIRLTGFNFEPISRVLKSELVSLSETRLSNGSRNLMWESDITARVWVDRVAPLAMAVRKQEQRAATDTDLTLAIVGLAAMPLALFENAAVTFIAFGLDLLDFGVTVVHELDQYLDSEKELTFSKGAVILLGNERYKKAQEESKAWYSAAFGIVMSGAGAVGGAVEAVPKAIAMRRIARGRQSARALENANAIDLLSDAERQNFATFAMSSHMRRVELGADSLTAVERRAIDLVNEYASSHPPPPRIKPDADLDSVKITDSYQPERPIAFEEAPNPKSSSPKSSKPKSSEPERVRQMDNGNKPPPKNFDTEGSSVPNSNPPPLLGKAPEGFDMDGSSVPNSNLNPVQMRRVSGNIEEPIFSSDIPNALGQRVPDETIVRVLDPNSGREFELELGARVGNPGSTSEAFELVGEEDAFVVRITYLREGSSALKLDTFGEDVLRNQIKSEHIRAVGIREEFEPAAGRIRTEDSGSHSEAVRVTIAERVTPAYVTLARQAGELAEANRVTRGRGGPSDLPVRRTTMSAAQMQAYEGALRDLNASGYVWLDNKPDNFAFVPLNDGSGRVQVVVIDTGGIVPVRQDVADFLGISKAELARQIQLRVNGKFETYIPEFSDIKDPGTRSVTRYGVIIEEYGDAIDLQAVGITDIKELWFNPLSGEMFDYLSPLFEAAN